MKHETVVQSFVCLALCACFGLSPVQAAPEVLQTGHGIAINFSPGRDVDDVKNQSIGEKMATFEPDLKIKNLTLKEFSGNKAHVFMLGESTTETRTWKVMLKQTVPFDLKPSEEMIWKGAQFKHGFDDTLAKSGYDYDGFIVLVENSAGVIVHSRASKASWLKNLDKVKNIPAEAIVTKKDLE